SCSARWPWIRRWRCRRCLQSEDPINVTPDNFVRAETDLYFGNLVNDGGFGKFHHIRELSPIDNQLVIRQNRDTLYSAGVFDLDAGPVTVGLPDADEWFMSLQVITGPLRAAGRLLRRCAHVDPRRD